MKYKVLLFANLREVFSQPQIELNPDNEITGDELLDLLTKMKPEIESQKQYFKISVNGEYSELSQIIPKNSEVAVFPPVSGG